MGGYLLGRRTIPARIDAVLAISDRTYVLAGGQLRMEGTPAELTGRPDFVDVFLGGGSDRSVPSAEA